MQSRIIFFLEIHNWCKWLDGSSQELNVFYCIPYSCKIEQTDSLQHNEVTLFCNGNVHVEISCFVKSNWKLLSLKMRRAPH